MSNRFYSMVAASILIVSLSGCYNRYVQPYGYGGQVIPPPGTGSYVIPGQANPDPYYNNQYNPSAPANFPPSLNGPVNTGAVPPSQWTPTGQIGNTGFQQQPASFGNGQVAPVNFENPQQPPFPTNNQPQFQQRVPVDQFQPQSRVIPPFNQRNNQSQLQNAPVGQNQNAQPVFSNNGSAQASPVPSNNMTQPVFDMSANKPSQSANIQLNAGVNPVPNQVSFVPVDPAAIVANPNMRYVPAVVSGVPATQINPSQFVANSSTSADPYGSYR